MIRHITRLGRLVAVFVFLSTGLAMATHPDTVVYHLKSLEGADATIVTALDRDMLVVAIDSNSTYCLDECSSMVGDSGEVIGRFLGIRTLRPGGSGERYERYTVFCVSKGRLFAALDVQCLIKENLYDESGPRLNDLDSTSESNLDIARFVIKDDSLSPKVAITERVAQWKGRDTIPIVNQTDSVVASFDLSSKAFITSMDTVESPYPSVSDTAPSPSARSQMQLAPTLRMPRGDRYCCIDGVWYTVYRHSKLGPWTDPCEWR